MFYLLAIAAVVALDQYIKHLVVAGIALGDWKTFIPGILRLTYLRNNGAAFSLMQNMRWLFIVMTSVFVIAAVYILLKKKIKSPLGAWSLCAIAAGALGNLIDRITHGYVVDMFETVFVNFAIFNVADCFITVGGIVFCVYLIFFQDKTDGGLFALFDKKKTDGGVKEKTDETTNGGGN